MIRLIFEKISTEIEELLGKYEDKRQKTKSFIFDVAALMITSYGGFSAIRFKE